MTKKIIAPRRSESLVNGSAATQRFADYLEKSAESINLSDDQVAINKEGIAANVTAIAANVTAITVNANAITATNTILTAKALLITANAEAIAATNVVLNAKALLITANANAITALTARVVLLEAKTSATIVTAVDRTATGNEIIICTNTVSKTITLMSSPVDQQAMQIKRTDETVIIAGNGKNIDGATSKTLSTAKESATLIYSTTAGFWSVI